MRQPQLGSMSTDLNSEFRHFNLVIRLSNVQQLALLFCAVCEVPLVLWSQGSSPKCLPIRVKLFGTVRNSVFPAASAFEKCSQQQGRSMLAGLVTLSFDGCLVRSNILCT